MTRYEGIFEPSVGKFRLTAVDFKPSYKGEDAAVELTLMKSDSGIFVLIARSAAGKEEVHVFQRLSGRGTGALLP